MPAPTSDRLMYYRLMGRPNGISVRYPEPGVTLAYPYRWYLAERLSLTYRLSTLR